MFGSYLRQVLQSEGVDTCALLEDRTAFTTLAFVALHDDGERHFAFVRRPGADTQLRFDEINLEKLKGAAVFHFGTLSLTHEPAAMALLTAAQLARKHGVVNSLDVNLRLDLWDSAAHARERMAEVLPLCDVVKLSGEELYFALEEESGERSEDSYRKLSERLLNKYPQISLLAVTLGGKGSLIFYRNSHAALPKMVVFQAIQVQAVDTTGAGDAYTAAVLHRMVRLGGLHRLVKSDEDVEKTGLFATVAAALSVTRRGAIASMPHAQEVLDAMGLHSK
jgi:sugar/nucleoside kinase (ribokinase family)